jgi:predicted ABC-type ATPase
MPDLYIIAGPNGSGKSTYSSLLLPLYLTAFDADKELKLLEKEFAGLESWRLMEAVEDRFEKEMGKAIAEKKDFAFETNLTSEDPLRIPRMFQQAGYRTNLIYIGLESAKMAIVRVAHRVAMGGHDVPDHQITQRYREGLDNLQKYARFFDRTRIYASRRGLKIATPRLVYELKKGMAVTRNTPVPKWAAKLQVEGVSKEQAVEQRKGRRR